MDDDDDIKYFRDLIAEYEVVLPAINEQLQFYKGEYGALKREIIGLTKENQVLFQKLEECASKHMALQPLSFNENDLIDNLKNQLNLSLKEKESVVELWRTSMTRIDYLENELKIYSADTGSTNKNLIRKLKNTYENEVKTLRDKLKDSNHKLAETTTISKTCLATKQDELEHLNRSQQYAQEQVIKLTEELSALQMKLKQVQEENQNLKDTIISERTKLEQTKLETYNAKLKVAEACHIIEAALLEKDAALSREKEANEEVKKLTATINEIVLETESKVKGEVFNIKEEYANKVHSYKLELKKCQEDLAFKTMQLDKKNAFCKQLETEIEELKEGKNIVMKNVHKEKQVLSGKVEHNKEKLINSERKIAQLKQQIKAMTESYDKLKESHNDELCRLEVEKKNLEAKIHSLENDLQLNNARFQQVNAKVEDLCRRIGSMDLQFKEELALKNAENERILTERLNEVECVNARINEELKTQLSTQINLNHKWKCEVRNVTSKLEGRIRAVRGELIKVRHRNANLIRKLDVSERKRLEYKENLKSLCNEFNTMANIKI